MKTFSEKWDKEERINEGSGDFFGIINKGAIYKKWWFWVILVVLSFLMFLIFER